MQSSWQTMRSQVNNIGRCNRTPSAIDVEHQAAVHIEVNGGTHHVATIWQRHTDSATERAGVRAVGVENRGLTSSPAPKPLIPGLQARDKQLGTVDNTAGQSDRGGLRPRELVH